ncbi:ETC complex I subunit [Sphingosinicella microcystinivorans]|uniref:ETC complex I subunit n=1 Tax=Sphingosinicella microcystinivorans TaxID=335406 RepID=UPI0022F38A36|nr:ETC complex I subunit [Sphingosinicella microcystinivorans]WBX83004.1 ETC complex I subunit [Sphingosinicella microcystinivorans]
MAARIYQRPKNAMQSGKAHTEEWVLEFERADPQRPDPLTGWAGSADTRRQLRLRFDSADAARAYAEREGLAYTVLPPRTHRLKIQAYADNFK